METAWINLHWPQHVVSEEFKQVRQAVPDDGRPEMPDMHFFGDVRGGIVDHDLTEATLTSDATTYWNEFNNPWTSGS